MLSHQQGTQYKWGAKKARLIGYYRRKNGFKSGGKMGAAMQAGRNLKLVEEINPKE